MARNNTSGLSPRFAMADPDLVEEFAEAILREEAWWIAARTGQYVRKQTVWVDERATRLTLFAHLTISPAESIPAR